MGWTGMHRERGQSNLDFFRSEYRMDGQEGRGELLDGASIGGTFYGVYRTPSGNRVALVVLMQWSRSHYNFTYKEMDEGMGPAETSCPARILDQLDEAPNDYAREWRQACRLRLAAKAARPKVAKGQRIRFAKPLRFSDGSERDTFEHVTRNLFKGVSEYGAYGRFSIPGWRDLDYAII